MRTASPPCNFHRMSGAAGLSEARACAALPWRMDREGSIEVLLVAQPDGRRWGLPKGWPVEGLSPARSAARAAFEQAGVFGRETADPIGIYRRSKRRDDGTRLVRDVDIFALQVLGTLVDWPCRNERKRSWSSIDGAGRLIAEPALAALLKSLRSRLAETAGSAFHLHGGMRLLKARSGSVASESRPAFPE